MCVVFVLSLLYSGICQFFPISLFVGYPFGISAFYLLSTATAGETQGCGQPLHTLLATAWIELEHGMNDSDNEKVLTKCCYFIVDLLSDIIVISKLILTLDSKKVETKHDMNISNKVLTKHCYRSSR